MALVDLVKGKDTPKPNRGPSGNIPTDSPQGAGINQVPLSSRIIGGAKDVNPLGSPSGRHIDSGNTILPQGSPPGRHINSSLGKGSLRKSPLAGE